MKKYTSLKLLKEEANNLLYEKAILNNVDLNEISYKILNREINKMSRDKDFDFDKITHLTGMLIYNLINQKTANHQNIKNDCSDYIKLAN